MHDVTRVRELGVALIHGLAGLLAAFLVSVTLRGSLDLEAFDPLRPSPAWMLAASASAVAVVGVLNWRRYRTGLRRITLHSLADILFGACGTLSVFLILLLAAPHGMQRLQAMALPLAILLAGTILGFVLLQRLNR